MNLLRKFGQIKNRLVKMPQRAQDAFETLNPGQQHISVQESRNRSNSVNSENTSQTKMENPLNVLDLVESNVWPSQRKKSDATKTRREAKISVGDFDTVYTAPDRKGYKREISHR